MNKMHMERFGLGESVQLVRDFGCRFVRSCLEEVTPAPEKTMLGNPRSAFDMLLRAAVQQERLSDVPGKTAKDTLVFTDIADRLKVSFVNL